LRVINKKYFGHFALFQIFVGIRQFSTMIFEQVTWGQTSQILASFFHLSAAKSNTKNLKWRTIFEIHVQQSLIAFCPVPLFYDKLLFELDD
jgi:hypothetical protein